jgi:TolB-like protein
MIANVLSLSLLVSLAAAEKPTLAVLYFDNNSKQPELEVMRKGLADLMVTDLVEWGGVTVVERDKLEAVLGELKLQRTRAFDQSTAVKVGKFLGAKYLLSGSLTVSGARVILDARVLDAGSGAVAVAARAEGSADDIFSIEQQLVDKLIVGIDVSVKNVSPRKRASVPSLDALLDYSKAIDLSDQGKAEEAQLAFAALVSKAPTFLMARERKQQAVKALEEYSRRKKDLVTASALRVAMAADEALKKQPTFDALPVEEQATFLALRQLRGRVLARALKQHLSSRDSSLRVVLGDHRPQALAGLTGWLENQRRLLDERTRFEKGHQTGSTPDATLAPELLNDVADAKLGDLRLEPDSFETLAEFIFFGRLKDGDDRYTVAPTWADLFPADAKALLAQLEDRIRRALATAATASAAQRPIADRAAISALEFKAEVLDFLQRDDETVGAYQLILDTFPTDARNTWREEKIKKLLGGAFDHSRQARERWAKALAGCDDMDLRVGAPVSTDRVRHLGLEGLDQFAAEFEKACPPSAKTRSALAYLYRDLAMDAARYEDCERFRRWFRKYLEVDGSVSDMLGYQKNSAPWCSLGDITKGVVWLKFVLDGGWTPEVNQFLVSIRSNDGTQLTINGHNEGQTVDLALILKREGAAWKCRNATWRTRDGDQIDGSCTVTLTKEGAERGDFDEGTFSASFSFEQDGHRLKTELTRGDFRVRRQ